MDRRNAWLALAVVSCVAAAYAPTREELLAVAEASPAAVAKHDKDAWLSLFTPGTGSVEDPVGTAPHVGEEALSDFWDVFIAPNDIVFSCDFDVVQLESLAVVRVVNISVDMPYDVSSSVPTVLLYTMDSPGPTADDITVSSLQAYWQLPDQVQQLMAQPNGMQAMLDQFQLMLQVMGADGIAGYMMGLRGVHQEGHDVMDAFAQFVTEGGASDEWSDLFVSDLRRPSMSYPSGELLVQGGSQLRQFYEDELSRVGDRIEWEFPRTASGFSVGAAATVHRSGMSPVRAAAIFAFHDNLLVPGVNDTLIQHADFYWEE